jgi:hypothetical protein
LRFPFEMILPTAVSILALLRVARQRLKGVPAQGWPTIQGTVVSGIVSSQHGVIPTYNVQVWYAYIVDGEYYSGFYEKTFLRMASAETFATTIKGHVALVRYAASLPERSALLEREQYGWPA